MSDRPQFAPPREPKLKLRDRIAIDAMCAYLGSPKFSVGATHEQVARAAYVMADAMLAEREKAK